MITRSYTHIHNGHGHIISNKKLSNLKNRVALSIEDEDLINTLRSLSDPTKMRIYLLLHNVDQATVTDIKNVLEMSQSTVSHALSDLKNLRLVDCQRCGQLKCYSLINPGRRKKLAKFLNKFQ